MIVKGFLCGALTTEGEFLLSDSDDEKFATQTHLEGEEEGVVRSMSGAESVDTASS